MVFVLICGQLAREWIVIMQMNLLQPKLKGGLLRRTGEIEPLSQTDQIDEAINYIKSQESKLQKLKEKKESLMRTRKRSYATACVNVESTRSAKAPHIKIHEKDSTLEVVLISGLENHQFMFYDIIRLLDEEHANVVHANFSTLGDSTFHIVRAEIGKSISEFGAARITEKLNRFVNGSTSDQESRLMS
nr:transcription factor bHLH162-like isoform X3 [Malus domestica]